jgi:hypothetical protein
MSSCMSTEKSHLSFCGLKRATKKTDCLASNLDTFQIHGWFWLSVTVLHIFDLYPSSRTKSCVMKLSVLLQFFVGFGRNKLE